MKKLTGGDGGHKRISDVAPVLIGALMVGGAASIAIACSTDADCPAMANGSSVAGKCASQGCYYL